jgi:hypothetical protein
VCRLAEVGRPSALKIHNGFRLNQSIPGSQHLTAVFPSKASHIYGFPVRRCIVGRAAMRLRGRINPKKPSNSIMYVVKYLLLQEGTVPLQTSANPIAQV